MTRQTTAKAPFTHRQGSVTGMIIKHEHIYSILASHERVLQKKAEQGVRFILDGECSPVSERDLDCRRTSCCQVRGGWMVTSNVM